MDIASFALSAIGAAPVVWIAVKWILCRIRRRRSSWGGIAIPMSDYYRGRKEPTHIAADLSPVAKRIAQDDAGADGNQPLANLVNLVRKFLRNLRR